MKAPARVRLRLLVALRLGDRVHGPGAIVSLAIDTAAHLLHQRRAVPVNSAGLAALVSHSAARP
jgi:hypothetical protein